MTSDASTPHPEHPVTPTGRFEKLLSESARLQGTDPTLAAALAGEAIDLAQDAGLCTGRARERLALSIAVTDPHGAALHLEQAARAYGQTGDVEGQLRSLISVGKVQYGLGEHDAAERTFRHAHERARASGHGNAQVTALHLLAQLEHSRGRPPEALELLRQALELNRASGDPLGVSRSLTNIGTALTSTGDFPRALDAYLEAYQIVREQHGSDTHLQGALLTNIGFLQSEMGEHDRARQTFERAMLLGAEHGHAQVETAASVNLGHTLLVLGEQGEAERLLRHGHVLAVDGAYHQYEALALDGLGRVLSERGDLVAARAAHEQAVTLSRQAGNTVNEAGALTNLARVLLRGGEAHGALGLLEQARTLSERARRLRALMEIEELAAEAHECIGDHAGALTHYRRFHALDRALFNAESDRRAQELTDRIELERARHEAEAYRLRNDATQLAREQAEAQVRERTAELEVAQLEVVSRLALAAEYRDDLTGEHTWRVGHHAAAIARALGLDSAQVELVRVAARLHDVGKIGVPDTVLLKPGRLTTGEFEHMKTHTVVGARILSGSRSNLLRMAEEIALTHHERWDGLGYPRGLRGEEIPLIGRIVAVADVYDALVQERPYKRAWTHDEAIAELHAQAGRQFDPAVVTAAVEVLGQPDVNARSVRGTQPQAAEAARLRLRYERASHGASSTAGQPDGPNLEPNPESYLDPLTGLPNRFALERDLGRVLVQAQRAGEPVTVVYVDVDGFGTLNDLHGMSRADLLLRTLAETLATRLGVTARLYRAGGDEFAAIVRGPGDEQTDGPHEPQWLLRAVGLAAQDVRDAGHEVPGVSAGVAAFPHDAASESALLRLSVQRMLNEKQGRARRSPET